MEVSSSSIRTIQREVVMVVVDMIRKGNAMSSDYSIVRGRGTTWNSPQW